MNNQRLFVIEFKFLKAFADNIGVKNLVNINFYKINLNI